MNIKPVGYCVIKKDIVWGIGETRREAWFNAMHHIKNSTSTLIFDEDDDKENFDDTFRISDLIILPISEDLFVYVEWNGSQDLKWCIFEGVCCTKKEIASLKRRQRRLEKRNRT